MFDGGASRSSFRAWKLAGCSHTTHTHAVTDQHHPPYGQIVHIETVERLRNKWMSILWWYLGWWLLVCVCVNVACHWIRLADSGSGSHTHTVGPGALSSCRTCHVLFTGIGAGHTSHNFDFDFGVGLRVVVWVHARNTSIPSEQHRTL